MSARKLGAADYRAALQCERRAWRARLAPAAGPAAAAASALESWLAERSALPGALEALLPAAAQVDAALESAAAQARTRELLADPAVAGIRGAALQRGEWAARVPLLRREAGGAFALCAPLADTGVREADLDCATFLAWLVQGSLELGAVELWHLDAAYRGSSEQPHWPALLRRRAVTRDVRLLLADVPGQLARAQALRDLHTEPEREPSPHCWRPQRCEHWEQCTSALPHGALVLLPRLRPEQFHALRERGVERIADIPAQEPLEPAQALTRAAWQSGRAAISPELGPRLRALGPALAHLDFETAIPAVPLLAHSGPLEPIPAQWSLLCPDGAGGLRGSEFLAPPGGDPRAGFAAALCAALADWKGPIAVYSDFEARVLARLEELEPERATELARIRGQLVDFLPLVRECVAHPDFRGSYSLKRVAAVLCPGIGYGDLLGIANGAQAAQALRARLLGQDVSGAALLAYCRRDVEALAALHAALCALAAQGAP